MTISDDALLVNFICPYCKVSFSKNIEYQKKTGLFSLLIKNHSGSDSCAPFIFLKISGVAPSKAIPTL